MNEDDVLGVTATSRGIPLTPRVLRVLNAAVNASGRTKDDIAKSSGMSGGNLTLLLDGKNHGVTPGNMQRLCKQLQLPFWKVFPLTEEQATALELLERIRVASPGRVNDALQHLDDIARSAESSAPPRFPEGTNPRRAPVPLPTKPAK